MQQYLRYFYTAEINSTFYALPQRGFIRHLSQIESPRVFFSAKLPRAITHDARLVLQGEDAQVIHRFFDLMRPLADRLACLLIQLPPWPRTKMGDLEQFLSSLDETFRYAIEFRHHSWLVPEVRKVIEAYNIAQVVVDEPLLPVDLTVTTDFAYVRWHGHGTRIWYDYRYSTEELQQWVPRFNALLDQVGTVLGYFNNHFEGNAAVNALEMLHLLGLANKLQEAKLARMHRQMSVDQTTLDDH